MARSLRILLLGVLLSTITASLPQPSSALAAELDKKGRSDAKEALRFYKEGNYEDAAKLFVRLSIAYPDMLVFVRNLGACYYYLHRYEPALSNLRDYLHRQTDIAADDRAEVSGWIGEMERLRDQAMAAAVAKPAPAPVPGATPAPVPAPPVPVAAPLPSASTAGSSPTPASVGSAPIPPAPASPAAAQSTPGDANPPQGPYGEQPGPSGPQPVPGPYGAQPAPGPYGPQPVPGPYGAQPAPGPYGAQPAPGPYGAQPAPGPYGAQPAPGPYGAQPGAAPSQYPPPAGPGYAPQYQQGEYPAVGPAPIGVSAQATQPPPQSTGSGRKVAAWIIGIAGVGALATGGFLTYKSLDDFSKVQKKYDPSLEKQGKNYAVGAGICYGVGAAALVTAIIVGVTGGSSGAVALAPAVGPELAGATLSGSF